MSETILDMLAQRTSLGSFVELTLLSQEKVTGKIDSINSAVIAIRQANGNIRLVKSDNLLDLEIKSIEKENHSNSHVSSERQILQKDNTINELNVSRETLPRKLPIQNKQTITNFNINLFERPVHIQAIEPDFKFDNITKNQMRELNKIKNKYDYALKIKELSRIRQTISELEEIATNANNHKIHLLCGQFAKLMDDNKKAEKYFQHSLALQNKQAAIMLAIS